MNYGLSFFPFVPWEVLGALALLAVLLAGLLLVRRTRGAGLRALAMAAGLLALANPSLTEEKREPLSSVVAVVVDDSPSQTFGDRRAQTDAARKALDSALAALPGVEVRHFTVDGRSGAADGTRLFSALGTGLSDVPPERLAGAILITDGRVHDVPARVEDLGFSAPIHALITGQKDEKDRRITLEKTPRFGIVGQEQAITYKVLDEGLPPGARVPVTIRRDGEVVARRTVTAGETATVRVEITHAGPNIVELEVPPVPGELTEVNNRTALSIDGVRDKLKVLLVSGEPTASERTWRNLLKSDANVDLVHFTILRPPEKQDATPLNELSLIAFPTRELFQTKINDFDLIIFDRYAQMGILPLAYFDNIARYVQGGGALLVASGQDYADYGSLYYSPLEEVLPAVPSGAVTEEPFHARLTRAGKRHPVTRDLPGSTSEPPRWSRFFRVIDTQPRSGTSLMAAPGEKSVLLVDHVGEGRVGQILTDQIWLWARGYEGGGPHVELLRRLSHWLMKEPDLEEERLKLTMSGPDLVVERQTMEDSAPPAQITTPTGKTRTLELKEASPGLWRATTPADLPGLWRAQNGDLTALANIGPLNPKEFAEVTSTTQVVAPLVEATGGGVWRLAERDGVLPRLVQMSSASRMAGSEWMGLSTRDVSVVRGISLMPLFAGLSGLLIVLGLLAATWVREGR
ncbi:hypothetical protein ACT6QH_03115 [Xanthobacter sp. TB0139]|uniref:hypothetical protein n=1 Tax=Xanthobacter sp. TB0139 TaxID=3459178 RepID=UPI0040392C13